MYRLPLPADDVTNSTIETDSVGLLLKLEFYMANTDRRNDINSETSQCSYNKYLE